MIDGVSFGDPNNPFDEPREAVAIHGLLDPVRSTASRLVELMAAAPDVSTEIIGDFAVRGLAVDCHAPFETQTRIYINAAVEDLIEDLGRPLAVEQRAPARLDVGDLVAGGEVVKRWARLTHPEWHTFGVTGVSRRLSPGTYERWNALTMLMGTRHGRPTAELWAEADSVAGSAAHRLTESKGQMFDDHFLSIYFALSSALKKRVMSEAASV